MQRSAESGVAPVGGFGIEPTTCGLVSWNATNPPVESDWRRQSACRADLFLLRGDLNWGTFCCKVSDCGDLNWGAFCCKASDSAASRLVHHSSDSLMTRVELCSKRVRSLPLLPARNLESVCALLFLLMWNVCVCVCLLYEWHHKWNFSEEIKYFELNWTEILVD